MNRFDEVLTLADSMSQDERENLIQILESRLRDERRAQLVADVHEARREFASGNCVPATPDEIMRQILE